MLCGGCFFFNWGVVALPCWASFCCTATWISCNSPHPLLSWFSLPTPHTLFSIIASSSLSLRFCSLPQSSVRTPRAPGNVLCYRKWLEGEGLRTHPKSLQKAHHPSRSPFLTRNSVSALWLPHLPHEKVCVCVCVCVREREEEQIQDKSWNTAHILLSVKRMITSGPKRPLSASPAQGRRIHDAIFG